MHALNLKDVHFAYGQKKILEGVSLCLKPGEIASLIGLSGSGKTTLFRLITGLALPDEGEITIFGSSLPQRGELVTYMRQEDLLLPWRTVKENLLLFQELGKDAKEKIEESKIQTLLSKVGLKDSHDDYPEELSGGMRQRASLARALLQNRPLFLLDEPFGSLDVVIREQLYSLIQQIHHENNTTVLLVTHDFRDALALSNRIFVLAGGVIAADFTFSQTREKTAEEIFEVTNKIRHILSDP